LITMIPYHNRVFEFFLNQGYTPPPPPPGGGGGARGGVVQFLITAQS
jgi:hypothetical protein